MAVFQATGNVFWVIERLITCVITGTSSILASLITEESMLSSPQERVDFNEEMISITNPKKKLFGESPLHPQLTLF